MNHVGREDADKNLRLMLASGGLRDMTRIASSPFHIWKDILRTNQAAMKKALQEFRESLSTIEGFLDDDTMETMFSAARLTRQQIDKTR
jgi:prephenate dehydrogenase